MITDVIAALAAHWNDVTDRLDAHQRARLLELTNDLVQSQDDVTRRDAAQRVIEFAAPLLPAYHPVRRALAAESTKFAPVQVTWEYALRGIEVQLASLDSPPDDIPRTAEEWILAAPAATEAEVRGYGVDPDDPGLIRLTSPDRGIQLPAFQFAPAGQPYPVVRQINLLLDAEGDPWGVADWWLGPNAWTGTVPAESIGQLDDQVLVAAAQAVAEEE